MAQVIINPVNKTCTPDPVLPKGRNATIVFKIDQSCKDWAWSGATPIVVTAPAGIFSGGDNPGGNGKGNVNVQDKNDDDTIYKYSATLIQDGAASAVTIDPDIQNDASSL